MDTILPGEKKLHPITLREISNTGNRKLLFTKPKFKNDEMQYIEPTDISVKSINKMLNPPITIDVESLLLIYNITTIDSLETFIKSDVDIVTAKRIFNAWIYFNMKILKDHNNILVSLCLLLLNKYNEYDNIKKEIKNFIDYWLQELNKDTFNLDIIQELEKYLIKKYK